VALHTAAPASLDANFVPSHMHAFRAFEAFSGVAARPVAFRGAPSARRAASASAAGARA